MNDLMTTLVDSVDITTIVTVILVIVLLLIIYCSPIAMLIPLLTIGTAYLISRGVLGYMGEWGINLWSQLDIFIIVLIFGVGTDYCLFLVSRYREELNATRHGWMHCAQPAALSVRDCRQRFCRYYRFGRPDSSRVWYAAHHGAGTGNSGFITLLAALTLTGALGVVR